MKYTKQSDVCFCALLPRVLLTLAWLVKRVAKWAPNFRCTGLNSNYKDRAKLLCQSTWFLHSQKVSTEPSHLYWMDDGPAPSLMPSWRLQKQSKILTSARVIAVARSPKLNLQELITLCTLKIIRECVFLCFYIIVPFVQKLHLTHVWGPTTYEVAFLNYAVIVLPLGLTETILFKET